MSVNPCGTDIELFMLTIGAEGVGRVVVGREEAGVALTGAGAGPRAQLASYPWSPSVRDVRRSAQTMLRGEHRVSWNMKMYADQGLCMTLGRGCGG